jgi:cytochrome c oxidase subunit II
VGAEQIAELSWLLFAVGVFVLAVILAALRLAMRGSAGARARLAETRTVLVGGLVFPVVTLTALLGYGLWLTRASAIDADRAGSFRIGLVGEQWWWRVTYGGPNGQSTAGANEIRIPVGRTAEFTLTSGDVIHSFWVPNLAGKVDMIPGRTTRLRVAAREPGTFRGQCAEYCGGPHALMAVQVMAMRPHEFEAWLAAEAQPAATPEASRALRGRDLFFAAGCGACHTVRGTRAAGALGPDLTHVGSRRSLGSGILPITETNLARFIADGQHLKPGNRMPPFRVLREEDRGAVAAYLLSLR